MVSKSDKITLLVLIVLLIGSVIGYIIEFNSEKKEQKNIYNIDEKIEENTESETKEEQEIKNVNKQETKKEEKQETKKEEKQENKTENKQETKQENVNNSKQSGNNENKSESTSSTDNKVNNSQTNSTQNTSNSNENNQNTTNNTSTTQNNTSTTQNNTNNNQSNNTTQNNNTNVENKPETPTEQVVSDKTIIPDKYNTGASSNLTKYTPDMDLGLFFKMSGNTPVINFAFAQNHVSEITIKNIDFTDYDKVAIYGGGEDVTDTKIKLIFKNCKFNQITTAANLDTDITIEFNNCSIKHFGGSNSSFNKCFFGGSSHDGMNPNRNVTVKNSYFAGTNTYDAESARHYDGVQMFGSNTIENLDVVNIYFNNVRFEVPAINEVRNGVPSKSGVNAPIMFALEYDKGNNVKFENIIANGGGYTVYATTKNGMTYKNLVFKNVKLGYGHLFGILYPMTDQNKANTTFTNFGYYDFLYVSSVWKDNSGIHVITTNDTLIERKLTCKTDNGIYNFNVKAHPKLTRDNNNTFKFTDMPYDINNVIDDKNAKYVKCYDTTTSEELTNNNLIRTQKF